MKKLNFIGALVFCTTLCTSLNAQQFIRNYFVATTGFTQQRPVDVNYHATDNKYFSLHQGGNGDMPVFEYDATNYNSLSGVVLFKPSNFYDPIATKHFNNFTAVLFNIPAVSNAGYGIVMYDHNTNIIQWVKSYSYPNATYDFVTTDMTIDNAGTTLFVTGNAFHSGTGKADIYMASVNFGTGNLNWHRRATNTTYDFSTTNIFYHSNGEIYIGANAFDNTSILNRGAFVMQINSSGTFLNNIFIQYDAPCIPNRLTGPHVKRLVNDVFVFCPSVVGADGSGAYFLAKVTPTLSSIITYTVFHGGSFYYNGFTNPPFEFVNNGKFILVPGIRSALNSLTPGYMQAMYDLNTNFVSAHSYPSTNTNPFGSPIVDAYNNTTNQVFAVAEDAVNSNPWYGIRSNFDGSIDPLCDTVIDKDTVPCKLLNTKLTITGPYLHGKDKKIKLFQIKVLDQKFETPCFHFCPGCEFSEENDTELYEDPKSFTIDGASLSSDELQLFPNPATNILNIAFGGEILKVDILSIGGARMKTMTSSNTNNVSIDISELPAGIYFVQVNGNGVNSKIQKFIKQ